MKEQKNNQLLEIVQESGLEESKAQVLLTKFSDAFEVAKMWEAKAKTLEVTSEEQVTEMKMAREGRLFLRAKRIEIEKTRKALKEQSLREGRAIDGVANVLKALITPIEEYLGQQEKYAEIKEQERKDALREERINELVKIDSEAYTELYANLDYAELTNQQYENVKSAIQKIANEKKQAELARIAEEKAKQAEQERIRKENERLQKEAEAREKELAKEREKQAKLEAERKEREALQKLLNDSAIKVTKDGDRFCVLYGEDLQSGVAGFGVTVEQAITGFCNAWLNKVNNK